MDSLLLGLCLIGCVAPVYGYHMTKIDYIDLDFNVESCQDGELGEASDNLIEL